MRAFGLTHVVDLITDFSRPPHSLTGVVDHHGANRGDTQCIFEELRAGQRSDSASGVCILREIRLCCVGRSQFGCWRKSVWRWDAFHGSSKMFRHGHLLLRVGLVVSTAFITVTELSLENMITS